MVGHTLAGAELEMDPTGLEIICSGRQVIGCGIPRSISVTTVYVGGYKDNGREGRRITL